MALNAATVWEVRTSGSNNNGGGWHDAGGASADYSQQDAAELSLSDVVTNGTTTVTSATGGFTDAMVGSIINILTKGRFEITGRSDTNTITIDRTATAGSGLTANVGGAVADPEEIDSILIAGNTVHIGGGTYNLSGALTIPNGAYNTGMIKIYGYNASRGDKPAEADMPLIAGGANAITIGQMNHVRYLNFTTTHSYGVNVSGYSIVEKCKSHNSGSGATHFAFQLSIASCLIGCTAISDDSYAVNVSSSDARIMHCRIHSSVRGIQVVSYTAIIIGNVIRECTAYGIYISSNQNYAVIVDNTIDDDVVGIYAYNSHYHTIRNNIISNHSSVGVSSLNAVYSLWLDYNDFYGNTADVSNTQKGDETMSEDPEFTAEDDYSLQATSNLIGAGEVITLDVG